MLTVKNQTTKQTSTDYAEDLTRTHVLISLNIESWVMSIGKFEEQNNY